MSSGILDGNRFVLIFVSFLYFSSSLPLLVKKPKVVTSKQQMRNESISLSCQTPIPSNLRLFVFFLTACY